MYIAINKADKTQFHSFQWTKNDELIICGNAVDKKDWEIVEVLQTSNETVSEESAKLMQNHVITEVETACYFGDDNRDTLRKTLTEIANNVYTPAQLRKDIISYNS